MTEENKEETVVAEKETSEETIKRMEEATKRLEAENAKLAKARAELEMRKVEQQLGGSAEAGQPPKVKTWQEQVEEDIQNAIPDEFLPRNLKKKK